MEEISSKIVPVDLHMAIIRAAASLNNMVLEMLKKKLELKRITKTATLLLRTGFSSPVAFALVEEKCLSAQHNDGGWVSIVDTMWNIAFLSAMNPEKHATVIARGIDFLISNQGPHSIWGRSLRDFERIPVSGTLLFLIPELATTTRLQSLENLWEEEKNSLTYKASYTLMAFRAKNYTPSREQMIDNTIAWLVNNQRKDGAFAPWASHPVASDTYCTAIALLGLLSYPDLVPVGVIEKAANWLLATQLPVGIWPFHEIEDGGSWALFALMQAKGFMNVNQ